MWNEKYDEFKHIFDDAYLVPLAKEFNTQEVTASTIFTLFLYLQANRVVIPFMRDDESKDLAQIEQIRALITLRSNSIKYRYDMLAKTLPENDKDALENFLMNYSVHKTNRKDSKFDVGYIQHSGNDETYNNSSSTTAVYSTTGEDANPRLENKTVKSTNPVGNDNLPNEYDTDNNKINTKYAHRIDSQPSDQHDSGLETTQGYYSASSKPKLLQEIRDNLNFSILDEWFNDIMPIFCLSMYD